MKWLFSIFTAIQLHAQCVEFDLPFQITECWEAPGTPYPFSFECNDITIGQQYWWCFEKSDDLPLTIIIQSDLNYEWQPNGSVWAHFYLFDGCMGELVFGTTSCAWGDVVLNDWDFPNGWISQNYEITLEIPAGEYCIMTGNVGIQTDNEVEGCLTFTVIGQGVLGLGVEEYRRRFEMMGIYDIIGRKIR